MTDSNGQIDGLARTAGPGRGPGGAPAASLVSLVERDASAEAPDRAVLIEVDFSSDGEGNAIKQTHQKALISGRFKLVRDDETGTHALYDLEADPAEQRDIAAQMPQQVSALRAELEVRLERARARRAGRAQR